MENAQNKKNVAQSIVEMLVDAGIKNIYAITGDSLNALTDAISKDGRIRFIHMRHEESGAFAASAEAQLTGRLACCAGSSGPGHVHLINGLYDANSAGASVLAIASTCATNVFGTDYFQETNPTLLFSNCSVYNQTAETPAQVPVMLQQAMQHAVSRGGVGVIGLPVDVITQPQADSVASQYVFATPLIPEPTDDEIERCAAILNNASTVAIFAGMGASAGKSELLKLADKLKAPIATTFKSQLELTGGCPNYVGHMGYLGMWSAEDAISAADAILIIGTNYPFPGFFPEDKKIIQVDVKASRIGKRAKVDVGVCADAAVFLHRLLPKVNAKTDDSFLKKALSDWAEIKTKMQIPVDHPGAVGKIRPEYVFAALDRLASDNAIFTVDTGMNCVWASHYLSARTGRKMVGSFTHGSMADAMPMAIGASLSFPERQVIALCGDGGLAMLMGDLLTIVQYQLPVKILVADNRSLAYVQWEMELAGYAPNEVSLNNPDFGDVARSIGFMAETVTDPAKLEGAMQRWLDAKGPALLSVTTYTEAASFTFSRKMMQDASAGNPTSNFLIPGN